MLRSFKRAYDLHLLVKISTWLALCGGAFLLLRIAGGFPPLAWRVLAQSIPQLTRLIAASGPAALVPFAGLLVLSITWAALWLLMAWIATELLWRTWFPPRRAQRRAKNWQRTSLDNLLDAGYDEPQASLAYASAHASFSQTASSSTPPPEIHIYPRSVSKPAGARAERKGWAGQRGRSSVDEDAGSRLSVKENLGKCPPAGARPASRPPLRARPGSRPPVVHRRVPVDPHHPTYAQDAAPGEHKSRPHIQPADIASGDATGSVKNVGIGWDAGIKRRQKPNEDSVLVLRAACAFRGQLVPMSLFAVADGMGGHSSGQVASHLATHSLMQTVLPAIQHGDELTDDFLVETMVNCAQRANQDIFRYREEYAVDLGTTLTAALVVESTACIINVGDSRTYLYRAGRGLRQITRDHSLVARLQAAGIISAEEVYTHPDRNKVYRSLGEKAEMQVDWFTEPVQPGDLLLLCSDGLWELVRDHEIEKILQRCHADPPQAADALIKAALHRGGTDNVSAVVARV